MHVTLRLLACDEPQGRVGRLWSRQNCVVERRSRVGLLPREEWAQLAGWLELGRPLASQPAAASDEAVAQLASHKPHPAPHNTTFITLSDPCPSNLLVLVLLLELNIFREALRQPQDDDAKDDDAVGAKDARRRRRGEEGGKR